MSEIRHESKPYSIYPSKTTKLYYCLLRTLITLGENVTEDFLFFLKDLKMQQLSMVTNPFYYMSLTQITYEGDLR